MHVTWQQWLWWLSSSLLSSLIMSQSSGHSDCSLWSKGNVISVDVVLTEKATQRKAAAHWEEEECALVLYLEDHSAAAGDGANFSKKHFIGVAQHLKDKFLLQWGGEKTASACHTKWGSISVISYLCTIWGTTDEISQLKEDFYAVQGLKNASGLSWCNTNRAGREKMDTVWLMYTKVWHYHAT